MDKPKTLCHLQPVKGPTIWLRAIILLYCIVFASLATTPRIYALDQGQIGALELKQTCQRLFDSNGRPMEIGDVMKLLKRADDIFSDESYLDVASNKSINGNNNNIKQANAAAASSSSQLVSRTCRDRLKILYNVGQVSGGNCHTKYLNRLEKMVDFYTVQERAIALESFLNYYRAKQLAMCKQNSAGKELKRLVFKLNNECIDTVNHYLAALDDSKASDGLGDNRRDGEQRGPARLGDHVPMSRFVSALLALIENQRGSNKWSSFFGQPDPGYNLWQLVTGSIGDSCQEVKRELGQHVDQLLGQFTSKGQLEAAMGPLTVKWIRATIVCRSFLANMDRIFHQLFVSLHAKLKIELETKSK